MYSMMLSSGDHISALINGENCMLKFLVAIICAISLNSAALAACGGVSCDGERITRLYPSTDGKIYVGTSGDESQLICTPEGGDMLTLLATATNADKIYSLLLSVQLTGRPLSRIRITTSSTGCTILYAWQDAS